jgi:hypothetical protein
VEKGWGLFSIAFPYVRLDGPGFPKAVYRQKNKAREGHDFSRDYVLDSKAYLC